MGNLAPLGSCHEEGINICSCNDEFGGNNAQVVDKAFDAGTLSVGEDKERFEKEHRPLHTFSDGASYLGQWVGNLRHGYGTHTWPDGTKYEGQWDHDNASGQGRLKHVEDGVYDGQWRNSKAHGHGIYNYSNGTKYVGQWEDDKQHGEGLQSWPDGNKYEGQYRHGRKNGKGHFVGPAVPLTRVSLWTITLMASVYTSGRMEEHMRASGCKIRCMAKAYSLGLTAAPTWANIATTRRMGMAGSNGQMAVNMREGGRMESRLELVLS